MVAEVGVQASLIGKTLGDYAVRTLIGRGAMGAVYLAKDVALGRAVALKVLLGTLARNPEQVKRFQMEAKAAAPLQHPNIVRIYQAGIKNGTPYIAMEYIEGEPLDRFLRRKGPRLEWQHALHIAGQVAEALDCAHEAGIVHRDVKPANILLDHKGRVRLTDFGIANVRHSEANPAAPGAFLGTPEYMSPEQCAGSGEVAPSSDLFSLGVMLYQMIAGDMPFKGHTTVALISEIISLEPPRLNRVVSKVPDDVARLVAHLLEKAPQRRPASAQEVCKTIARLQRENGGASAVPEALDAFIREQTQPRRLAGNTPTPVKRRAVMPRITVPEQRKYFTPISLLSRVVVAVLFATAGLGAGYWRYVRPAPLPGAAPVIDDFAFSQRGPGILTVPLPSEQWSVTSLHWVGRQPVVVAELEGRPGTASHGARGLLAVNPEDETMYSMRPPLGPVTDSAYWRARVPGHASRAVPAVSVNSPWSEALLVQAYSTPGRGQHASVLTLAQRWNEAEPRAQALFSADVSQWNPRILAPWSLHEAGDAVASPNGRTLCLLLYDPTEGTNYLTQRDTQWRSLKRTGPRLTTPGAPIVPKSIHYAPDGRRIAYQRQRNPLDRELWLVAADGSEGNGRRLATGRLETPVAFSPDGDLLAATLNKPDTTEIILIRVDDGAVAVRLGPGYVSSECWHPSGNFLIATARDTETGYDQLWGIEARAPYRRHLLSRFEYGLSHGAALGRDSRWAVAMAHTVNGPVLAFFDLSALVFATPAAEA